MTTLPADPQEQPAAADAAAHAEADHRLARTRRRRARRRRHQHMRSAAVLGVLVGIAGAVLGVAGAVSFVDSAQEDAARQAEERLEEDFLGMCQARLKGIDCGCLYRDARPAFLPDTREAVLDLIAQREILPLRLQRIRTERLVGPELGKMVWAAAYYCVTR